MSLTKVTLSRLVASLLIALSLVAVSAPLAHAQINTTEACEGIVLAGGTCDDGEGDIGNVITAIVNILTLAVGAISVIMIIVAGFRYVTSGGDSSGTAAAKNTIIYAIVGLVVVLLARAIIGFVITRIQQG